MNVVGVRKSRRGGGMNRCSLALLLLHLQHYITVNTQHFMGEKNSLQSIDKSPIM